jgi:hypothetical protein
MQNTCSPTKRDSCDDRLHKTDCVHADEFTRTNGGADKSGVEVNRIDRANVVANHRASAGVARARQILACASQRIAPVRWKMPIATFTRPRLEGAATRLTRAAGDS